MSSRHSSSVSTYKKKDRRDDSRDHKDLSRHHRGRSHERQNSRYERHTSKERRRRSPSPESDKNSKERRNKSLDRSEEQTSKYKNNKSDNRDKSLSKQKKSKKKPNKSSSSSSSSSSTSSDSESSSSEKELKLLKRLEDERLRQVAERKKQKELMKANETPEEKRARRLKEKREKERRRRERMGWDGEYQHYTNQDNPFGDAALTQTFVWNKKLAREGLAGASNDEIDARNRQKQFDNKIELEKVKKRRNEREAEREAREEEALALQRGREAAEWRHWRALEDAFHLQQARLRTHIRIQDGRAKAIDLLAWYVSAEGEVDAVEMHEPYTYLNGLQIADLEDLLEDIKVYKELEKEANQAYWSDITTIVQDELEKLRAVEGGAEGVRRDGIHHAVAQDVTQVFKGKTGAQLEALQQQIEEKIRGRHDGVDIGYWESLLSQLKAHMARARLRDRHQQNLRCKLQLLKQEQGVVADKAGTEGAEPQAGPSTEGAELLKQERLSPPLQPDACKEEVDSGKEGSKKGESDEEWVSEETDMTTEYLKLYVSGRYSPTLTSPGRLEPGTLLTEPEHDEQRIAFLRGKVLNTDQKENEEAVNPGVAALEREARRDMGADEVRFSVEANLPDQLYLWSDKYRPRKPRYFNRVHTGFEWNKYNQTHYDMDNPPPKIVQGYKFNIFYPDLIDKNSTPQFSLKPCPDNPDFGVLRFHAGPPYEDIAFKIVNREWEYSYKRGFRCQFQNNIFQLWFHFKRYRYRR